jgi:S1-C subfamily serine protease
MQTMTPNEDNPLLAFSDRIADLVETLGRHVVAVHVGRHETVSGVVWRDGAIVTVAHALRRGAATLTLPDGTQSKAQLAGIDGSTDLAVLRLEGTAPTPAPIGDAATVRTGHWVLTVGRGGHGDLAADQGIVGRTGPAWQTWRGGRIDRLLRLDGGLNPGFSGAPIADARGQVIGIGTSALARGYGIVIPASTVNRVADALLAKGRVANGYLGIGTQPVELPASVMQKLRLDSPHGLLITGIAEGSPAEQAGWLIGDILLELGERKITDIESLYAALGAEQVGEHVHAALARGGSRVDTEVTVGERPRAHC